MVRVRTTRENPFSYKENKLKNFKKKQTNTKQLSKSRSITCVSDSWNWQKPDKTAYSHKSHAQCMLSFSS